VYSLTRAVLANRYSRNAFFVYCIGLHLLVVIVLYWLATAEVFSCFENAKCSMNSMWDGLQKDPKMLLRTLLATNQLFLGVGVCYGMIGDLH
jgi:hypothetical protein